MAETIKEYIKYFGFFIILAVAAFGSIELLKTSMGVDYPLMVVVSESMEPTLNVGDFILVSEIRDFDGVIASPSPDGEILVFKRYAESDEYIVHRAIDKYIQEDEWYFTTKGDNNNVIDQTSDICPQPIKLELISGKARLEIHWLGTINLFFEDIVSGKNTVSNVHEDCLISLGIVIAILVSIPIILDVKDYLKERKNKKSP